MTKLIKDFLECNNSDILSLLEFLQSHKNVYPNWQYHVNQINNDLKQFNVKIVNNNNTLYLKKI